MKSGFLFAAALLLLAAGAVAPLPADATGDAPAASLLGGVADTLIAADGEAGDLFGHAVALSGNTALVGRQDPANGAVSESRVYVFVHDGDAWSEQATLLPDDHPVECGGGNFSCPFFGWSVAIEGDRAVVGAHWFNNPTQAGAVYVFEREGEAWSEQARLMASDGTPADRFGSSVAISGDTILIGAPGAEVDDVANNGAAYVFVHDGDNWVEQTRLMPLEDFPLASCVATTCPQFGHAVALLGETALVGAENMRINGNNRQGAAFVFTRDQGVWTEQIRLTASDGAADHRLGAAVALSADTALVGASTYSGDIGTEGAAYVFVRDEGGWTEQTRLLASDAASIGTQARFGAAVALLDGSALVGAFQANISPTSNQGAAYLFSRQGGTWQEQQRLTTPDGGAARFGNAVALSGTTALVGAFRATVGGNSNQGAAYVFGLPAPGLAFAPHSLNFGQVPVGETSEPLASTLTNTGDGVATGLVFGTPGNGFVIDASDCGDSLAAGDSCQVDVTFSPADPGAAAATLDVSGDGGVTAALNLSGHGQPAGVLAVNPAQLNFPDLQIGETHMRTATIGNTAAAGAGDLTLSVLAIDGDAGFTLSGGSCAIDGVLAPGQNCTAEITFAPEETGQAGAMFTAGSTDAQTAQAALAGTGLAGADDDLDPWLTRVRLTLPNDLAEPPADHPTPHFGASVALAGDTALVGRADGFSQGEVYVFVRNGDDWIFQAVLEPDEPVSCISPWCPAFGSGLNGGVLALSASGDIAVVGMPWAAGRNNPVPPGSVYIFEREGGEWSQRAILTASDGEAGPTTHNRFGNAVAISGDTILVGAEYADWDGWDTQGGAYVFVREGDDWVEQTRLVPEQPDGDWPPGRCQISEEDPACPYFGNAVALEGDTAVVGARQMDVDGVRFVGAAYVFTRQAGVWSQQAKLTSFDGQIELQGRFGAGLFLTGDTLLVGALTARMEGLDNVGAGAVYVFTRDGDAWTGEAKLTPPLSHIQESLDAGGDGVGFFGQHITFEGNTALITAPDMFIGGDGGGRRQGAVYRFERHEAGWTPPRRILSFDGVGHDLDQGQEGWSNFGWDLGLSGGTALVSAVRHPFDGLRRRGAAYVIAAADSELQFEPMIVDFGLLQPGVVRERITILHNLGEQALDGLEFSVLESGFDVDASDCGETLAVDESCTLQLTFSPPAHGEFSATLQVQSTQGLAAEVRLSGRTPPQPDGLFGDRFELK